MPPRQGSFRTIHPIYKEETPVSLKIEEIRFDGDVVIVTGGAGGIGRSQAIELGRRGARVVVNDLGGSPRGGGADPTMAQTVVDEIVASGGEALTSVSSVSSDDGPTSRSSTLRWIPGAGSTD